MVSPDLLAGAATVAAGGAAPGLIATEMATGQAAGPEPALERGATIGRYLILERLGSGGMGVVFLAYDPELDRKLALKLLHTGPAAHAEVGRVRLLREAQAMAKLTHPNVVAVHDVGTFAGQVFVAMDFVRGQTLGGWLAARKLPWREVVRLFLQAGAGLAAAHAAGLVHRDFKPKTSRLPSKAPLSAKRRGSPTIGAFEREAVCPGVVRSGQDGPKLAQN